MIELQAAACGASAQRILAAGVPARVIGLTSRGIFCVTDSAQVVFLSFEAWRGPLTINLVNSDLPAEEGGPGRVAFQKSMPPFERVSQNSLVSLQAGQLSFVDQDIRVQTGHLPDWKSSWSALEGGIPPAVHRRYQQIAQILARKNAGRGWSSLLDSRAQTRSESQMENSSDADLEDIARSLDQFAIAIRARDLASATAQASRLLGRGTGLTPSGDDVITGFLLALNRFAYAGPAALSATDQSLPMDDGISIFQDPAQIAFFTTMKQRLVELARQKTTWLGAALIECAASGQADERLTTALDAILTGSMPPAECARRLLAYGSSSGTDAWLGVVLAFGLA
jgi:hypothetical protein